MNLEHIAGEAAALARANGLTPQALEKARRIMQEQLRVMGADAEDRRETAALFGVLTAPAADEPDGSTGAPTLPEYAYRRLPPILAEGCSHFKTWYERDVFLTGCLGVLSSALPCVRFGYDKTYHSPHLMLFVLAKAGRGKGAMSHALRLVDPIVADKQRRTAEEREVWEARRRAYDKARRGDTAEPPGPEPKEQLLRIGEDLTLPALFGALGANPEGLLMAATEADAISGAMRREHGGFSPIIRAAFHHETVSKTLKGEGTLYVNAPRLAVVVSGTEDQFAPLVDSVDNGLFSRFGVYRFAAPLEYRSRLHTSKDDAFEAYVSRASADVARLYGVLESRERPLYVDLPAPLWKEVDAALEELHGRLFKGEHPAPEAFAANVYRGFVIAYRIACVLTLHRLHARGADLAAAASVEADRASVEAATALALVYVELALHQAVLLAPKLGLLPDLSRPGRMTDQQRAFLDALPERFTTADALRAGAAVDVHERTVKKWLSAFTEDEAGLLRHLKRGQYEKVPAPDGVYDWGTLGTLGTFPPGAPKNADFEGHSQGHFEGHFRPDTRPAPPGTNGTPVVYPGAATTRPPSRTGARVRLPDGRTGAVGHDGGGALVVHLDGGGPPLTCREDEITFLPEGDGFPGEGVPF